jgi:hypothetical protein
MKDCRHTGKGEGTNEERSIEGLVLRVSGDGKASIEVFIGESGFDWRRVWTLAWD